MSKIAKTIIWLIVVIVIVVGIWYGLTRKPTPPAVKEPIKIGAILPLSGKLAVGGQMKVYFPYTLKTIKDGQFVPYVE